MKLEDDYLKTKENNPYWSSINCFTNTIINGNYKKTEIGKTFNKVVDKKDYERKDKERILGWLMKLTSLKNGSN